MTRLTIVLIVIAIVGVVAVYSYFNSEKYKIRKHLASVARTPVRSLRAGQGAKVIGRVVPVEGSLLSAPLTGRPCVFYEVIVEECVSRGRSSSWVERVRETKRVDFALDDTTGVVRVPSRHEMRYVAHKDSEQRSGAFNDAAPHLEAFLLRHGLKSTGWVFNKTLRYHEGIFEPGESVVVAGVVAFEEDPEGARAPQGYRDSPKRPVLTAPPGEPLVASDEQESTSYA